MAIGAGAAGAWAAVNATTQTVTLPAHAAGDLLVLIAACKAATPASLNIRVTTPATGWTKIGNFADGTTASGVGTGSVTQAIFTRVATSNAETNPVVTWGGTSTPGIAVALDFTKAVGEMWLPVAVQKATNGATSISVTMNSNPGITAGDYGIVVHTIADDSALTVPTWTATSATLGTATVHPATPIASGTSNDMAGTAAYRAVTSGTASAAPVCTATQVATATGVTGFIRLRVTTAVGYYAAVTADSPVAYWRLGEPSGTNANDEISTNDGTYVNAPTLGVTGALTGDSDTAVTFNGTDEHITVADSSPFRAAGTASFSIEAWVKRTGTSAAAFGIASCRNATDGWYLAHLDNGSSRDLSFARYELVPDVNTWASLTGPAAILGTTWHHIVATYSNPTMQLYLDGAAVGVADASPGTLPSDSTFYIARSSAEYWNGTLDEVAFYNVALTQTQILTHYAAAASPSQRVTPTTKALALATFAPTVTATDNQAVTPTTTSLTLAAFAPSVGVADNQTVTPTTRTVVLATFAPTVTTGDNQLVTPTTQAVTLATFAPTVTAPDPQLVTPTTTAITLATFAPTVSNPDPQLATPSTTAVTLTTFAPSVSVSDAASIVPPNAALALTTYAPTVTVPDPQLVTPSTSALELHGFEPVITATNHQAVIPTTAALVTTRHIPTVAATAHQTATPTTKALTLTAYASVVRLNEIVTPITSSLTLTHFAPAVTATTGEYVYPDPASLTITGYAPDLGLSAHQLVIPTTAVLVITPYPVTVEVHSAIPLPDMVYGFAIVAMGDSAGVGSAQGGATVTTSEGGSTAVSMTGPSARVSIR